MYSVSTIISAVVILIICIWIRWRKQKLSIFQRYKIPGPKPNFIFGNLPEFHKKRNKFIQEGIQKYGKIFGFFLGAKPYLVCADIEFLKLCQIKDAKNFTNKDWLLPDGGIPHKLTKYMLALQKDEKWKNMRSLLNLCFTSSKIKMMSTQMSDALNIFLENVKNKSEKPFDIVKSIRSLIFDIICTSAFGVKTNVQNNESNLLIKSIQYFFNLDSTDIFAILAVCFPETEPIPTYLRRFRATVNYLMKRPAVNVIHDTCKKIINFRKKSGYHPPDLLQSIIDVEDEVERKKLPDDFVVANAKLFMATGYDTTSNTSSWGVYHLSRNPEIQEKIRQEIKNNVQKDSEIQYSDLSNLQYLDQVVSEILRFWPLSFVVANRVCAEDFHYKDITIPKGTIITVPIPYLHNDPNYWHEPDKFDPERFSLEKRREIDSIVYQPFGVGPRMCIGMRLGKTIIKLVIANLIRSFRLEFNGEKEIEVEYSLFIDHPKNGIFIKAIPINP